MLFQQSAFETIDVDPQSGRTALCADVAFEEGPRSRRRAWLSSRIGFIGSAEGFDLLRFEAPTLALTRTNAEKAIKNRLIDVVVVEHAVDDLTDCWGLSFYDWQSTSDEARSVLRDAAAVGLPRIALMRGGPGEVRVFAPLAAEVDHVLVTQAATLAALTDLGVKATESDMRFQPALYNSFVYRAGRVPPALGVVSMDLHRAIDDPKIAAFLSSLIPFGLEICTADVLVRTHRVKALGRLADYCLGTVTAGQLRVLLKSRDVLLQVAHPGRDPGTDLQHALHAAACRCIVAIFGEIDDDDPRRQFAKVFSDESDLRAFLSRLSMDHAWAERELQKGWRVAHRNHPASTLALRIAKLAGEAVEQVRRPMATVVTPTFRPELLERTLANFRSQTWEKKELIIVANTDSPTSWPVDQLRSEMGEQIVFLSRRFTAGTALNIGAGRAKGDYVMRMDDDDYYGQHYIEDMMLGADAIWPDIMGKSAVYYNFVDEGRFAWVRSAHRRPSYYMSKELRSPAGGHIAGFTHTVHRDVFTRTAYPHFTHGAADSGFLVEAEARGNLLCARADGLNAVVQRRSDLSTHTWQGARPADDQDNADMSIDLDTFLS